MTFVLGNITPNRRMLFNAIVENTAGLSTNVVALLDTGSTITYATNSVIQKLGLKIPNDNLALVNSEEGLELNFLYEATLRFPTWDGSFIEFKNSVVSPTKAYGTDFDIIVGNSIIHKFSQIQINSFNNSFVLCK